MAKHTITVNAFSEKSIQNAIEELKRYQSELTYKCQLLAEKLAEKGVEIARVQIGEYDAVYTGELLASINSEQGAVIQHGAKWIIYTNCPWAKFVEFGTGIVGKENPYPISIVGWKYDVNEHGEKGWFYFRDGEWHWTKGLPSRPFMYNTANELRSIIVSTAKEVFG